MIALILALAVLGPSRPSDGWRRTETVRATGFEQLKQGTPRPFTVLRSRDNYLYECTSGIDGALSGVLRTESGGPRGFFTWLSGEHSFVLQLPVSTAPELYETTFSLSDPSRKGAQRVGKETFAARTCSVFRFSQPGALDQDLWVEDESGITIRQIDRVGGTPLYIRELDQIETGISVSQSALMPPHDAVVIRGPITPNVLRCLQSGEAASLADDLAGLRSKSGIGNGNWILGLNSPQGYEYEECSDFERGISQLPRDFASPLTKDIAEIQPVGQLPFGWSETGSSNERTYSNLASRSGNRYEAAPKMYEAPDGHLLTLAPPSKKASSQQVEGDLKAMVRLEYLNKTNGDTVVFFQMRNVPLVAAFPGYRLGNPRRLRSSAHSKMSGYIITSPSTVNVVEWRSGDSLYAIAATGLDFTAIEKLADSAT
jgi:hypothetical protein